MKTKNYCSVILAFAFCAVTLFALYCTKAEFDNPLDPNRTNPRPPKFTKFAITFDANGGQCNCTIDSTGSDSTLAVLPEPEARDEYTFAGWFNVKETNGGTQVTLSTKFAKNSIVYARWVSDGEQYKIFSITFNSNGGSDEPAIVKTKPDSTLAELPEPKARDGYTFVGWFPVKETTGGTQVSTGTKFRSDSTVYARWVSDGGQYKIFTVTLNPAGGSISPTSVKTVEDSTLASLLEPESRLEYDFDGWFTQQTGGTNVTTSTKFTKDSTIYAQWTAKFKVEFVTNGSSAIAPQYISRPEGLLDLPAQPTLIYRNFAGYFLDNQTFQNEWNFENNKVTSDMTLYLKWTPVTVTLDANGGTVDPPLSIPVNGYGRLESIPEPKREGYTHKWYTAKTGGTEVTVGASGMQFPINDTIYALWTPIRYKITYHLDGDTGAADTSYTVENTFTLPSALTKAGHIFGGWFANADLTGTKVESIPAGSTVGNKEYWAKWIPVYTVTFDRNGATSMTPDIPSLATNAEKRLSSLPEPARTNYHFGGWFTARTGGDTVTLDRIYSANVTIFARWYASTGLQLNSNKNYGIFTDTRDSVTYRTITIGSQVWMAENLNYAGSGVCYDSLPANCSTYGRLYTWAEAMGVDKKYNSTLLNVSDAGRMGICPTGWHLPSSEEWELLITGTVGSWETAGASLKAKIGWNSDGNGTDASGFSALSSGWGHSDGSFNNLGYYGFWWSAAEYNASLGWARIMYYSNNNVSSNEYDKSTARSVRCVMN